MNIEDAYVGQMVRARETGEPGVIHRIDLDEFVLWVDIEHAHGIDRIDLDPADVLEGWK